MFNFFNGWSPPLMNNIFKLSAENPYNLSHVSEFSRLIVKTVSHGTESTKNMGPK